MKIASFLSSLNFLFVNDGNDFFFIVQNGSEEERYATEELNLSYILSVNVSIDGCFANMTPEQIILNSDLGEQMDKRGIESIFIKNTSDKIDKWGEAHGINILSVPYQIRDKFEDKIFFEGFLLDNKISHPRGYVYDSTAKELAYLGKSIVQIPTSSGCAGTFVAGTKKDLKEIVVRNNLPLLVREYVDGLPLSLSILITNDSIYKTAVERQCFAKTNVNNMMGRFIGIQWIPFTRFSKKNFENIDNTIQKLGRALYDANVRGLINIDFILDKNGKTNIIECNPRVACATKQILPYPSLRNKENIFEKLLGLYSKTPSKDKMKLRITKIPQNKFPGCQMFISNENKVVPIIKSGFFVVNSNGIKRVKLNDRFDFLWNNDLLFYYNEIGEKDQIEPNMQIGTIMANMQLFNYKTGNLNKKGKLVYSYFQQGKQ